ncbi:MAG: membrane protein [Parcubacteria group bacterium Gr01-1014_31]|nr:MAG: membrane protein [Parcubacteria group bacterium Gr01-1014_31]
MANDASDLSRNILRLFNELTEVKKSVERLNQRVAALEGGHIPVTEAAPLPPPYQPEPGEITAAKKPRPAGDLEARIGGQWLAKIGVLALLLGVSFFLKYAFDNNWIGPAGRVMIGVLFGVGLLGLGEYFRPRYGAYGQALSGGGIAVLYLSAYASYGFYHLVPSSLAFVFMAVVTVTAGVLSVLTNQVTLVGIGIVGGFLTPLLVAAGQPSLPAYFGYLALLDVGILGVSFYRNWRVLNLLGLAGTALLYTLWYEQHYVAVQQWTLAAFLSAFFTIFLASTVSHNLVNRKKSEPYDLVLLAVNGFGFFLLLYELFDGHRTGMSFAAMGLAVLYFGLAVLSHEFNPEDKRLALSLPGLSVTFLTVALGLILEQRWLTLGWAVEAVVLVWLSFTLKDKFYRAFAAVISVLVLGRLLAMELSLPAAEYRLIANPRVLVFAFSVACLSGVGALYHQFKAAVSDKEYKFIKAIVVTANMLALVALSAEVVDFYAAKVRALVPSAALPTFGRGLPKPDSQYYAAVRSLRQWESITLSILWALYAVGVIAVGFVRKSRLLRVGGILLIGFTMLKFFLYDLWGLGTLYRIIISIALGVLLLVASFGYNKYKDRIKGLIQEKS